MGILDSLISRVLSKGVITLKEQISLHAYQIRFESDALNESDYVPGNFLRIHCGMGQVRSYSVWRLDREKHVVDMAVCTHSNGPGSAWIRNCKPGDELHFKWHKGKFVVDDSADNYLFVGDLSALGHLYEIQRNLSDGKNKTGIIYSSGQGDFFPDIDGNKPFDFYELPVNPVNNIIAELPSWVRNDTGHGIAYLGGDSRTCAALFHYLKDDLKWDVRSIRSKPFWNITKRGLE